MTTLFRPLPLILLTLVGCGSVQQRPPLTEVKALDSDGRVLAERISAEFARQRGDDATVAEKLANGALISEAPGLARTALRAALRARKPSTARVMLGRWRELDPEEPLLLTYAAALALSEGDTASAMAEIARDREPEKLPTRIVEALRWLPDVDRVLPFVVDMASRHDSAVAAVTYSRFAEGAKAPEIAHDILDQALTRHPDDAILLAYRANLARERNPSAARADLLKAVALKPDSRELRLSLAAIEDAAGDPAAAARVVAGAPGIDEEMLSIELAYAAKANELDLIQSACKRLDDLPEPRPTARLQMLGTCAELAEDLDAAMRWYAAIPTDDPLNVEAGIRIAALALETGDFKLARAKISTLREQGQLRRAELVRTYLLESEIADKEGDAKQALDVLDQALQALPDNEDLLYARSLRFEGVGNIDGAESDLRRLLELDPDNADALNALGYTLADNTKRFEEALALIERAMRLKPDDAAILDSMGWVKFRLGRLEEAIGLLRTAYAKQPEAEIAAHLGEALWQQGRKDEARKIWQEAKTKQPKDAALNETLRRHGL